ncbi:MAG TPA: hypothetical protein VMR25_13415 [Planctomycetaceae bacterium]|nr:hypothetical protein [Planctomycetaceae bacterium]
MPVWHDATKRWVKEGKLVLLGVTQEQHAERCRLFAQWKRFDWPILYDPINVLQLNVVPILLALDEHGIVRSTRPNLKTFEADFLDKSFADDAVKTPEPLTPSYPPKFNDLKATSERARSATAWRRYGDALALWGGDKQLSAAITAYGEAVKLDPNDGAAWFRLGVSRRRRYETKAREGDDFRAAVEAWGTALDLDPNQYIWRRRIQQYGPRLDKPYPFYDWVAEAEASIRHRGESPVVLPVRPDGAEIAQPTKVFAVRKDVPQNLDPKGRINRDTRSVACEVVVVPATVKPGRSARVHLTFRLAPKSADHWNNEAEPLRVWVDPLDGVSVSTRLVEAEKPKTVASGESRTVGFEVQIPKGASGTIHVPVYALYHLCDDAGGQCRFLRLDVSVELKVKK